MRTFFTVSIFLALTWTPVAKGLLVVGDSGSDSIYTNGINAGVGWDYVGHLNGTAPSSVSYVSNGWFVTANHVWTGDVVGRGQDMLELGGTSYLINTSTYTSITNSSGIAADLCMFRVSSFTGLPEGMSVLESTPQWNDDLRLIGNGNDNAGNTGLTWGTGTPYYTGNGPSRSTVTLDVDDTTRSYLSIYDTETSGSAYAQIYDSGGGVFVNDQLAGIMIATGTSGGEQVSFIADFSTYGEQINAVTAIPEPSVLMLGSIFATAGFCVRRIFMI